jgi:DNA-binding XRE family transcriptional regulator
MSLNETLRTMRQEAKLTQIELATKIGIAQSNYCAIEKGRYKIGKKMANRLARVFNVEPYFFLGD